MILFWSLVIIGIVGIYFMLQDIIAEIHKQNLANKQSREILEMIKQTGKPCAEPTFSVDVQPDFSGYLN